MLWYSLLIAAIAVERIAELVVSKRNWAWSRERGGSELGAGHYPVMVVLHVGLLVGCPRGTGGRRPPIHPRTGLADAGRRHRRAGPAVVVHHHARAPVEHPRHGHPRRAARHRRALPDDSAPQLRGGGRRGNRVAVGALGVVHRPGLHGAATPHFCARGSRSRTPRSRAWRDRPAGRRRRSRGAGHRTVRREGRAGRRRRRAPKRRVGQGVRRRHDASYPRAPGSARHQRRRADRCAASPTSQASGGSMRRSGRASAAACVAPSCTPRCGRLPKQPG